LVGVLLAHRHRCHLVGLWTLLKNGKQQTIANCFAKAGFQHMSDTNTPDDALDNQDIELPDQLTQAEFDLKVTFYNFTLWYPADELCNFGWSFCCGKQLVNLSFKCVEV
jgi:hypothetical protein